MARRHLLRPGITWLLACLVAMSPGARAQDTAASNAPAAAARATGKLSLQELTGRQLKLVLDVGGGGPPKSGMYEYKAEGCGGMLQSHPTEGQPGFTALRQRAMYGNCPASCTLLVSTDLSTYRQVCDDGRSSEGRFGAQEPPAPRPGAAVLEPIVIVGSVAEQKILCEAKLAFQLVRTESECRSTVLSELDRRSLPCRGYTNEAARANCIRGGADFGESMAKFNQYHQFKRALGRMPDLAEFLATYSAKDPLSLVPAAREDMGRLCKGDSTCMAEAALEGQRSILRRSRYLAGSEGLMNCVAALPLPHAGATAQFYGHCQGETAKDGLLVWSYRGQAIDLGCLKNGSLLPREEIYGFSHCEAYWQYLPGYCKAGSYQGQCSHGAPHGVGIKAWSESTGQMDTSQGGGAVAAIGAAMAPGIRNHFVQRGQYVEGRMSGFGFKGRIDACGMAGCAGPATNQLGWFTEDRLSFQCPTYEACLPGLSGAAYTALVADDAASQAKAAGLREAGTTDALISAFELTKNLEDLRRARALARTQGELAKVEYTTFRIAGFEKVVAVEGVVSAGAGGSDVKLQETEKILGYIRSTRADLPLTLTWRISAANSPVAMRSGSYKVRLVIGIRATTTVRNCVLGNCRDDKREETLQREVEASLSPRALAASGSFDLKKTSAQAGSFFGMSSLERLASVEPFVRLESMELIP